MVLNPDGKIVKKCPAYWLWDEMMEEENLEQEVEEEEMEEEEEEEDEEVEEQGDVALGSQPRSPSCSPPSTPPSTPSFSSDLEKEEVASFGSLQSDEEED